MEHGMMKVKARGSQGTVWINGCCVESMNQLAESPRRGNAVRIVTSSGAEYFVNFDSPAEAEAYIEKWVNE